MKIRTLREAEALYGLRVRYMRRGSGRYGWNGIINWANTRVAEVIWTTPQGGEVYQEYQLSKFFHEDGEDDTGESYIMIVDQKFADEVKQLETGVATPEEDEEFERLNKPNIPIPDWPLREVGQNIERFGKLLQDPKSTMSDLAGAAHDAGLKLRLGIQPKVEETTHEGVEA